MSLLNLATFLFMELVTSAGLSCAHAIIPADLSFDDISMSPLSVALIAIAVAIAMVTILSGCAFLCPCRNRFKSIEDDNPYPEMDFPDPPMGVDLGMYPPIEGTPDHDPVSFDPLPDVSSLMKRKAPARGNVVRLRPKVSHVVLDRPDSDEDIGGDCNDDSVQSKLEKFLQSNAKQNFQRNQINYVKEIGSGWFGKVLQCDGQSLLPGHRKTSAVVQILREDADRHDQYSFLQESAPYRDSEHPNVLKLLGQCVEVMPYLTVLELCINGDLKTFLVSQRSNIEAFDRRGQLLSFACDMAAGLQAMHLKNYVHRDFAVRNCLVTADLTVKIGDYGLSEGIYKEDYYLDPFGALIPIRWLAPEVLSVSNGQRVTLQHITKDCNLWSFGVALWELVTFGSLPYAELSNEQVLQTVICERSVRLLKPEIPITNLDHLYQLMELCWLSPAQRPSLRELRIMLLHLQSSSGDLDTLAFDQKWNQLLPRRHAEMHSTIATIETNDFSVLPSEDDAGFYRRGGTMSGSIVDELQAIHDRNALRSSPVDSRLSELDPALLVHSEEFQSNLLPWSSSSFGSLPTNLTSHRRELKPILINELSLEAELADDNFSSFHSMSGEFSDEKKEFVIVSDLGHETKSMQGSKVVSGNSPLDPIHHATEVHRLSQNVREEKALLNSEDEVKATHSDENSSLDDFEELNRDDSFEKSTGSRSGAENKRERTATKTDRNRTSAQLIDVGQKTSGGEVGSLVVDITNNNGPNQLLKFSGHSLSSVEQSSGGLSAAEKAASNVSTNAEADAISFAVISEDQPFINQKE